MTDWSDELEEMEDLDGVEREMISGDDDGARERSRSREKEQERRRRRNDSCDLSIDEELAPGEDFAIYFRGARKNRPKSIVINF